MALVSDFPGELEIGNFPSCKGAFNSEKTPVGFVSEFPVEFAIICFFPNCEGAFGSEKTPVVFVSEFPVEFAIICFPAFLISVDIEKTPDEISVEFSNIFPPVVATV